MRLLNRIVNPIYSALQGRSTQYFPVRDEDDRETPFRSNSGPAQSTPRLVLLLAFTSFFSLIGIVFLLARPGAVTVSASSLNPSNWHKSSHPTKHVVLASYKAQDVQWMERLDADWKPFRYVLDDPAPTDGGLPTPNDNGREAMAYLTYIVENYHDLPDYVMFIHGHLRAWHQPEPITMKLRNLNLTALDKDQFINTRCPDRPGCGGYEEPFNTVEPQREEWSVLREFWASLFPDGDPVSQDGKMPAWVQATCCGQFAVAKSAIAMRSREDWIRIREPLVKGPKAYPWGQNYDGYRVGLLYEKVWHLFFGKGAIECPDADYCRQVQFSNGITCDRYPEGGFPALNADFKEIHCWDAVEDSRNL